MEDHEKHAEVCELLKIWFYLTSKGLHWPNAKQALEERINLLTGNSVSGYPID